MTEERLTEKAKEFEKDDNRRIEVLYEEGIATTSFIIGGHYKGEFN